mgnify:CR=1 FL=1
MCITNVGKITLFIPAHAPYSDTTWQYTGQYNFYMLNLHSKKIKYIKKKGGQNDYINRNTI